MKRLLPILLLLYCMPLPALADRPAVERPRAGTDAAVRQIDNARKIERKFQRLRELLDKGWITEDDYQRKKQQYLDQL